MTPYRENGAEASPPPIDLSGIDARKGLSDYERTCFRWAIELGRQHRRETQRSIAVVAVSFVIAVGAIFWVAWCVQ